MDQYNAGDIQRYIDAEGIPTGFSQAQWDRHLKKRTTDPKWGSKTLGFMNYNPSPLPAFDMQQMDGPAVNNAYQGAVNPYNYEKQRQFFDQWSNSDETGRADLIRRYAPQGDGSSMYQPMGLLQV